MTGKLFLLMAYTVCVYGVQESDDPTIARWEKDIARLEKKQQTETTKNGIVFYGSSSIRLWDSIKEDMGPWPAIQRGYGGAKLPDIIHYAPRMLGPHLGKENPNRCRAVVLFVANDISGDSDTDCSTTEVAERFSKLLKWIREKDPSVPVFWIEVTPTHRRWDVWPKIENASSVIRTLINNDKHAHFIATAGAFLGNDGRPKSDLFVADQLHLNRDGYRLWSSLIKAQLYHHLGSALSQPPSR